MLPRPRPVPLVLVGWLLAVGIAAAQTPVMNPSTVTFKASPDHATLVTSYVVEVWPQGGSAAVRATDIGKPAPNATSGDITVPLTVGALNSNTTYVAYVTAKGSGGSTRSATPSVPFVWAGAPAAASDVRVQ